METIVNRVVAFDDIPNVFNDYIEGNITGRTVVRI